ncbi:MAG: copper homeostasis protein CutC [Caldilineaceae bacterium]
MLFEICIDSVEGAIAAQEGGARRVELCDNLVEGGTTPSIGMIKLVRNKVEIGVNVIIRPRGGDFLYSDLEFEVMKLDIQAAKEAGADAVVFGLLNADGTIDKERTAELVALSRPMPVTFHRAFDMTPDAFAALETLIELGVDRVLTSGQQETVAQGLSLLTELVKAAGNRIIVMPGGGSEHNVKQLVQAGVSEIHMTARSILHSQMEFRRHNVFMGGPPMPDEFTLKRTDAEKIRKIRELIDA